MANNLVDSIKDALVVIDCKIDKIEAEMNKVNAEGDLVYSKSEIMAFQKAIDILKGDE